MQFDDIYTKLLLTLLFVGLIIAIMPWWLMLIILTPIVAGIAYMWWKFYKIKKTIKNGGNPFQNGNPFGAFGGQAGPFGFGGRTGGFDFGGRAGGFGDTGGFGGQGNPFGGFGGGTQSSTSQSASQQSTTHSSSQAASKKKVIGDDEGDYVEFEEVK